MCNNVRVEFLLKTDSGYPKDTGVNKPWQPLRIPSAITPIGQLHQSPPSPIPGDLGRGLCCLGFNFEVTQLENMMRGFK